MTLTPEHRSDRVLPVCVFDSGFAATVLQKAQVRIINHSVCDKLMGGQLTSRMLCAGVLSGGVDACQVIKDPMTSVLSCFLSFCFSLQTICI